MAFHDEKDGDRRRKVGAQGEDDQTRSNGGRNKRTPAPEVGQALRTVYQRTVDEDIPPEFLDLLGKLG